METYGTGDEELVEDTIEFAYETGEDTIFVYDLDTNTWVYIVFPVNEELWSEKTHVNKLLDWSN